MQIFIDSSLFNYSKNKVMIFIVIVWTHVLPFLLSRAIWWRRWTQWQGRRLKSDWQKKVGFPFFRIFHQAFKNFFLLFFHPAVENFATYLFTWPEYVQDTWLRKSSTWIKANVDKNLKCWQMSQMLTNVTMPLKFMNEFAYFWKPDGKDAVWGIEPQFGEVQSSHQCTRQHLT